MTRPAPPACSARFSKPLTRRTSNACTSHSMAELFKTLFTDPRLQSATLVPHGVVTTPGGKEVNRPVMRMTCDRAANRQIDWDVIASTRPDGFKSLCHYEPLVALGRPSP